MTDGHMIQIPIWLDKLEEAIIIVITGNDFLRLEEEGVKYINCHHSLGQVDICPSEAWNCSFSPANLQESIPL